jgi:hypothetical protein
MNAHISKRPLLAAAGAFAMLPLLAVGPAHASTTDSGCTVTPQRPAYSGTNNAANIPIVNYKVTAQCTAGLSLHLEQVRMEQDTNAREGDPVDDQTGTFSKDFTFPNGGTKHIKVQAPLPNTGPANEGPVEEVYHQVRFKVTDATGTVTSPFTAYELTSTRSIHR